MRHRQRALATLGLTAGTLALALPSAPANSVEGGASVRVTVTNLRNQEGVVMACMTADEEHFPRCRSDANSYRATVSANGQVVLRFDNVLPGTYAIALLHDENENGKADRALSMIPKEGFGFSRDAAVRMGPPDFEDAAFEVGAGPVNQTIRMRYML